MNEYLQELFYRANAASYPEKWEVFYPLKDKLLKEYGVTDGWDLQVIEKECWDCNGSGIDIFDNSECQSCWGTGIYSSRNVKLDRYQLGDRIYHIPQNGSCPTEGYKNKITGLIKHEVIAPQEGWNACQLLMDWYKETEENPQIEFQSRQLSLFPAPFDPDGVCRAAVIGGVTRVKEPVGSSRHEELIEYIDSLILDVKLAQIELPPRQPLSQERLNRWQNRFKPQLEKDVRN